MDKIAEIIEQKIKEIEHIFCLLDEVESSSPAKYALGHALEALRQASKELKTSGV